MDATRSDWDYLYEVIEAVIERAPPINIADTVGYVMPDEFGELISASGARSGTPTRR